MGLIIWLLLSLVSMCVCGVITVKLIDKKREEGRVVYIVLFSFLFLLSAIIFIVLLINTAIYGIEVYNISIPSWLVVKTKDLNVWVGFLGSLIGAVIGGLITLFVLSRTIDSQEKNTRIAIVAQKEENELLREQYKSQLENQHKPCFRLSWREENDRCGSYFSMFDTITISNNISFKQMTGEFCFEMFIENISKSISHNTYIVFKSDKNAVSINLGNVSDKQKTRIDLEKLKCKMKVDNSSADTITGELSIVVLYMNILNKPYVQASKAFITIRKFNKAYMRYDALTSPKKLTNSEYSKYKTDYIDDSEVLNVNVSI